MNTKTNLMCGFRLTSFEKKRAIYGQIYWWSFVVSVRVKTSLCCAALSLLCFDSSLPFISSCLMFVFSVIHPTKSITVLNQFWQCKLIEFTLVCWNQNKRNHAWVRLKSKTILVASTVNDGSDTDNNDGQEVAFNAVDISRVVHSVCVSLCFITELVKLTNLILQNQYWPVSCGLWR